MSACLTSGDLSLQQDMKQVLCEYTMVVVMIMLVMMMMQVVKCTYK